MDLFTSRFCLFLWLAAGDKEQDNFSDNFNVWYAIEVIAWVDAM